MQLFLWMGRVAIWKQSGSAPPAPGLQLAHAHSPKLESMLLQPLAFVVKALETHPPHSPHPPCPQCLTRFMHLGSPWAPSFVTMPGSDHPNITLCSPTEGCFPKTPPCHSPSPKPLWSVLYPSQICFQLLSSNSPPAVYTRCILATY